MEQSSSSSKVTVEYYDPYGVYQLLSPGLLPRLPLRNLHWESHAGPLRSISSLHVDLVPATQGAAAAVDTPSASTSDLTRVKSEDSTASGDDGFRTQAIGQTVAERPGSAHGTSKRVKERRHQIPGLRQTTYLKVLLLRCDDNDTYKAQARKQVREWVKEHAPPLPTSSKVSSPENHDAFEWLIIHVIVPNTAAATQPRTSGKSADGSASSATDKSATRWRGGGSSTILEKLRADFNGSSKSAVDRIAQIRIGINDVPYDMLPRVVPAIPGSYSETQQENDSAWLDLITKFKERILASFDARVSQYEEDIREKDGQRSLPGWNFCTFFVLKEGLARGFESVGLVEDALVGYDELSIGLDAIIREHRIRLRVGAGPQHGASFLPFTEDLKRAAEQAKTAILSDLGMGDSTDGDVPIDLQSTNESSVRDVDEIPLNVQKKRYRELILANDISIFDFRCYLFSRQLTLLLRKANATSSTEELLAKLKEQRESSLRGVAARLPALQPSEDAEDLTILGEICRRSMAFVASIARVLREDIWAAQMHGQPGQVPQFGREKPQSDPVMIQVVDNMVSSFTFSVAQQILAQTSTKALPIPPSTLAPPTNSGLADGQEQKSAIPEPKTMMHPARTSSLALRSSSREPPSPGLFPGARRASVQDSVASSNFLKAGLEELAAHRAELYLLSRNVLEQVGRQRGWSSGWQNITHLKGDNVDEMEEIDLSRESNEDDHEGSGGSKPPPSSHGIDNKLLETALQDEDDFYRLYETLTDKALRHFTVANHIQSSYSSMADLAILKYHLKDYAATASYFYRIAPFYGDDGWAQVELSMLVMWAKCLRELQRKEEYVRVVVKLLSKAAMIEKERLMRKSSNRLGGISSSSKQEPVSTASYLPELLAITKALPHELQIPLENFFSNVEVDATPQYHSEQDSFALQIRLRYLLSDDLNIEKAKVRLAMINGDNVREVWLETEGPSLIKSGTSTVTFWSNVVVPGAYLVNCIALHTSNVVLRYEHSVTGASIKGDKFFRCPKLLIYHRPEAYDVRLFASRYMHLNRTRYLEIGLLPGWNKVQSSELHLRAATAGLRLQTSEGEIVAGSADITKKSEAGVIRLGATSSYSMVKLRLPFSLEHEVNDIALRVEVTYKTEKGTFSLVKTLSMSIMLPLGVNVQDVFKHKALFSKFTISSATSSPLRLLRSRLEGSDLFSTESGTLTTPVFIFPRQPASMLYKVSKISEASESNRRSKNGAKSSLSLVLNYICLEEEIDEAITQALQDILQDTPLQPYSRLIIPTVIEEIRSHLSAYDLERIAILSEIPTSILPAIKWRDYFTGLGRIEQGEDVATVLAERLHRWQKDTSVIRLSPISVHQDALAESRSIIIPVDVPSVTVVHTADLKIHGSSSVPANTAVAALNQPLSACLVIKSTRQWDTAYLTRNDAPDQTGNYEFYYEISGAADTWLIGGRRKGHFRLPAKISSQNNNEKTSFPVVLVPLREGFLPLPTVEIKSVPAPKIVRPVSRGQEIESAQTKQSVVTCETDYKNIGETIRVISDARKTTVSLDASGPQGGAWLLESERRTAGNDGTVIT